MGFEGQTRPNKIWNLKTNLVSFVRGKKEPVEREREEQRREKREEEEEEKKRKRGSSQKGMETKLKYGFMEF